MSTEKQCGPSQSGTEASVNTAQYTMLIAYLILNRWTQSEIHTHTKKKKTEQQRWKEQSLGADTEKETEKEIKNSNTIHKLLAFKAWL